MPYGSGQRLGDSIQAGLGAMDFSAVERAGAAMGSAFANLGQDIGDGIKKYKDNEKTIKKSEQMAKSIRDAIPELAPMATNALNELNNADLSLNDRLAIAEGIQESLKIGVLGLQRNDSNRNFDFLERQEANRIGEAIREREASNMPDFELEQTTIPATINGVTGKLQVWRDKRGNLFDLMTKQPLNANGQPVDRSVLPPRQNSSLPTSDDNAAFMTDEQILALEKETRQPGDGSLTPFLGWDDAMQMGDGTGAMLSRDNAATGIQAAANLTPPTNTQQPIIGFEPDPKPKETSNEERIRLFTLAKKLEDSGDTDGANIIKNALISAGSGSDLLATTKMAEQKETGEVASKRGLNSILNSSISVLGEIDKTLTSNPMLAKAQGGWAKTFEASKSGQIEKELTNIRNETSKASIFEIKKLINAVGQTTEKEWPRYESRFGEIKVGMNPEQVKNTVKLNALNTFEAVYGSPDKMNQMLKDGKINQSQFNEYTDSYLQIRRELQIPETGVYGNSLDWSRLDKGLLQQSTSRPISVGSDFRQAVDNFLPPK